MTVNTGTHIILRRIAPSFIFTLTSCFENLGCCERGNSMQNRTDATGDGNRVVNRIYQFYIRAKLKSKVNPHASHTSHATTGPHASCTREELLKYGSRASHARNKMVAALSHAQVTVERGPTFMGNALPVAAHTHTPSLTTEVPHSTGRP